MDTENNNLYYAYRELTSRNDSIVNTLYWLEKYLKINPNNKNITEIYELLLEAEKNANEAFLKLDNTMSES